MDFLFLIVRYIRRGKPDAGFALFESESLKWPGFVEFDDVNGKVLTFSAQDRYMALFIHLRQKLAYRFSIICGGTYLFSLVLAYIRYST